VLRVGLTGGIGSGKSTVARRLASHGAVVVDADLLAREVLAPGSDGLRAVVAEFGGDVLAADGTLDRPVLGRLVFADPAARGRLEAISHPRIQALTAARMAGAPADAVVVHDMPLLVELGFEDRYHLTVVVHSDEQERVRRLVTGRGSTEADARSRMAAQADDVARRAAADVWLENTGDPDDLEVAVDELWRNRLVRFERNVRDQRAVDAGGSVALTSDPTWPATGSRLRSRLRRAVSGAASSVEHIGSTAVPGLAATDVVDLQLVVADLAAADALAPVLADAGFPRRDGDSTDGLEPGADGPWQERLHGSADPGRPVDLHLRVAGSPGARYALLFRDWLRSEETARREYEAEKQRVAWVHPRLADYAEAKEPWLTDVAWPRMRLWAEATGWTSPA